MFKYSRLRRKKKVGIRAELQSLFFAAVSFTSCESVTVFDLCNLHIPLLMVS